MIGTKLAHYEITSHLGSGGMGDVYQATDAKLSRSVAIKFLPEAFSHDADRVSRFQREARVLASLNHPNIASIYGVEEIDSRHVLVMELVPGETLAERVKRGAIPIEDALPIAKQAAEALEEAHEKGIIHRDLKPANIKVTPEGKVKVLDFGLVKAYEREQPDAVLSNVTVYLTTELGLSFTLPVWFALSFPVCPSRDPARQPAIANVLSRRRLPALPSFEFGDLGFHDLYRTRGGSTDPPPSP